MIVEDSPTVRDLLVHLVGSDARLEVAATASSAEEALELLPRVRPDVITMDIRLPGMNGFEATSLIMARQPTPVVVVSASVNGEDLNISMNALRAGALAVIEKPLGLRHDDYAPLARKLCTQLVSMSQVKVVRQRIARRVDFPRSVPRPQPPRLEATEFQVVGLAASTGGPAALVRLFNDLPPRLPLPVLLVQHMASSFIEGFVSWLDRSVPQPVVLARAGVVPEPGTVYVAPGDRHLEMGLAALRLSDEAPYHSQRPSATVLFRSLARRFGPAAVGIVLTGMGDDGAEGLLEMRQTGAFTMVEDESTAVVFGMPAAALALGAVNEACPLPRLGRRLLELLA